MVCSSLCETCRFLNGDKGVVGGWRGGRSEAGGGNRRGGGWENSGQYEK